MPLSKSESGKLGAIVSNKMIQETMKERIAIYTLSPTECAECKIKLSYDKRKNKFCSKVCSGVFTGSRKKNPISHINWVCISCNKESTKSRRFSVNNFCNSGCQQAYQSLLKLEEWKKTGEVARISGTPGWLKKYILEKQDNKCAECGIVEWNNKPIVFDMEHKDGNSDNNLEENLCCMCPNCHSQTSTYKGKNKGNGRHSRRDRYAAGKSF